MEKDFSLSIVRFVINFLLPFLAVAGRLWSLKRAPEGKWTDIAWRGVFANLAVFYAGAFFAPLFGYESLTWLNPPYRRSGTLDGLVVSGILAFLSERRFRAELAAEQGSR